MLTGQGYMFFTPSPLKWSSPILSYPYIKPECMWTWGFPFSVPITWSVPISIPILTQKSKTYVWVLGVKTNMLSRDYLVTNHWNSHINSNDINFLSWLCIWETNLCNDVSRKLTCKWQSSNPPANTTNCCFLYKYDYTVLYCMGTSCLFLFCKYNTSDIKTN